MSWLEQPWSWWVSGILIGLTVPMLYLGAGKAFGISTSLQQIDADCFPSSKCTYFSQYDRRAGRWLIVFCVGIGLGGWIGTHLLSKEPIEMLPSEFSTGYGMIQLLVGGFLIGFGSRYAGGCTSGHSITGIAHANWPSLVATICFFVGGLAVTWGLSAWLFPEGIGP